MIIPSNSSQRRPRGGIRVAVLALTVAVACAAPALAAPPGFDLFETDPQATSFSFTDNFTLPAGFFGPGSDPFAGQVDFCGEPLNTFNGKDVGDADTVVHRPQGANLAPPYPATDTVPIELVALSLVSCAPIQVKVGGKSELWDVRTQISPTQPSTGFLRINQDSEHGGTFDSQLNVTPLLTFTRLPDGMTRTFDMGQLYPKDFSTPQARAFFNDVGLRGQRVPWRAGCVFPALVAPGLNDGFCPSFTPDGQKLMTVEAALKARHGILPAQPRLEHFKCYAVKDRVRFRPRDVTLKDQFGAGKARVVGPADLCNPVRKNSEPFVNRTAHLTCYATKQSGFNQRKVIVRNQFGWAALTVTEPRGLCVAALKRLGKLRPPPLAGSAQTLTDDFACYAVKPAQKLRSRLVTLRDQFDRERVRIVRIVNLCAPVSKNGGPVRHPVRHLVCYRIQVLSPRHFRERVVQTIDQFGREVLRAIQPRALCVPSQKILAR